MKTKGVIGILLLFLGTNFLTYATARYSTTRTVLTQAEIRMKSALDSEGLLNRVYSDPPNVQIHLAIRHAGGMYYWWNEALMLWGLGSLIAISGGLIFFVTKRKNTEPND